MSILDWTTLNKPVSSKEEYEEVIHYIEAIERLINNQWQSEDSRIKTLVAWHQKLAAAMLSYEGDSGALDEDIPF
jgi:hypothetical protein